MAISRINPETLARPHGFVHVVKATGTTIVFTSGQVGIDAKYHVVGTDYRSQAKRAAESVYEAVAAAGGTPADIARLMVYVVDATEDNLEQAFIGVGEAGKEAGAKGAAMTAIGVTALSDPNWLVEIDATAVLD